MNELQPLPTSQTEQRAQRLTRMESFYDGLDTVDQKLEPGAREQFQEFTRYAENPQEARAQAVNKAYLSYLHPDAKDAIESQWETVRQQAAAQLGINKPEVTDTELYGALSAHVKDAQEHRANAMELAGKVQLAALEGESDWRKTYSDFITAGKKPGAPLAHMDELRQVAEAASVQIGGKAAIIGPAVKTVAQLLTEAKDDPNPLRTDEKEQRQEAIINALMPLKPEERTLAMQLAARKVAREQPATERGGLEKAGESLTRGVENVGLALRNFGESVIGGSDGSDELGQKRQILRELAGTYNSTVDPLKGGNLAAQGLINFAGMIPQLGLMTNPAVGIPLLLQTNIDSRRGQLQSDGVPAAQAGRVAMVQGSVDTALNFVSSNMVFGKIAGGPVGGILATAKTTGDVLARVGKIAAIETGTMAGVTAAQQAAGPVIQELGSHLSDAVPGVDWEKELSAFKQSLPETIATVLPMIMVGTGTATFHDFAKFGPYMQDQRMLKAVGFDDAQALKIAGIEDPAARMQAIRDQWDQRNLSGPEQADALEDLDTEAEQKKTQQGATIEKNADGTYKVTSADGTIAMDGITDPAEAQRSADALSDRGKETTKALTDLAAALKGAPTGEKPATPPDQSLGIAPPGTGAAIGWVAKAISRIKAIAGEVAGTPAFTEFKQALNRWVGTGQIASLEIRKTAKEIIRAVPDATAREGITAWLQAGGDTKQLQEWAKNSTIESAKRGYEAALKLTPDELKVANNLRDFYQQMLIELQNHGIVDDGLENYVNQMWQKELPSGEKAPITAGKLTTQLRNAKERTFGSYFEGEQAGYKPVTKDISKLVAIYANEVSKVLATRQLIKDLTERKGSDGRPLAAPLGNGALFTGGETDPSFIRPLAKDEDTMDYRTLDHSALSKWKWIADSNGSPVMLEGQLGLHPEIFGHMKAALGKSVIREWYDRPAGPLATLFKDTVHGIDKFGQITKGTMLGFFSPFHQVQEATHALGHKINPFFNLPDLDPADPNVRRAVTHGLMLAGDNEAMAHFQDAINDPNPLNRIPVLGDLAKQYGEFLFHDYIPRLKLKTWDAIRERNSERYAADLKAGKITASEIDYLSAQQTNAAYGHLNYADLGRDPTLQHIARLVLLAPDFLEARGRFFGQAVKGLAGPAGREQLTALATLAVTQYMTARILNKVLDDDWHMDEPFSLVVGNRRYTLRSVPEDFYRLMTQPRQFAMGRISPLIGKGIFELATGKNWRGERVTYSDTFKELATAWIPISLRAIPALRSLTETDKNNPISPWEQFLGSMGLQISRHGPAAKAYELARDYNKATGIKEDTGTYPTSDYQPLRYALEDGDLKKAGEELAKLKAAGKKNIAHSFSQSLFHAYTGKDAGHEHAFRESLDAEGKHAIEAADENRRRIWERFSRIWAEEQAKEAPKPTASVRMDRDESGKVSSVTTEGADGPTTYTPERDPKTGRITRLIPKAA